MLIFIKYKKLIFAAHPLKKHCIRRIAVNNAWQLNRNIFWYREFLTKPVGFVAKVYFEDVLDLVLLIVPHQGVQGQIARHTLRLS